MAEGKPIYAALMAVQADLKAPKGQHNKFGGYNYRSAEDIIEAVKPLLKDNGLFLNMSDDVVQVGDRYYIKATVKVTDIVTGESVSASAMAREAAQKKGMDDSQITGTASSYARKYALNGLFAIDDTRDADTNEYSRQTSQNGTGARSTSKPNNYTDAAQNERSKANHAVTAAMKAANATSDDVRQISGWKFGNTDSQELTVEHLNELAANLGNWIAELKGNDGK